MPIDQDLIVECTGAFWSNAVAEFPELITGDSQLSGEPEAAISFWLTGSAGDNPVMSAEDKLPVPLWVKNQRIVDAVQNGISAAHQVCIAHGQVPHYAQVPDEVVMQLDLCLRHILHWNLNDEQSSLPLE